MKIKVIKTRCRTWDIARERVELNNKRDRAYLRLRNEKNKSTKIQGEHEKKMVSYYRGRRFREALGKRITPLGNLMWFNMSRRSYRNLWF